jgi:alpha-L-fucosidase
LRELMTEYGELFEVWFDSANGGDGYYGGARETRRIDARCYYGWDETWNIVRKLQPDACMFSDIGPDIRWVGNEIGIAGDPCWHTLSVSDFWPGNADIALLNSGERDGTKWLPAECCVSIRPGWFYHPLENEKVRSPENLLDLYFKSVGRGASLLLNLPPDRRGKIHENDAVSLAAFRKRLDRIYENDLARNAVISADNTRGDSRQFGVANLVDGDVNTYWATDDGITSAEIILTFSRPTTFNIISIREHIPLGQRIDSFAVYVESGSGWREYARGESIGNRRIVRGQEVRADRIKLAIEKAAACPSISEIGIYIE